MYLFPLAQLAISFARLSRKCESYLSDDGGAPDIPKYHRDTLGDTLEDAIVVILREDPSASQPDIAARTGKFIATVKRAMKRLADTGKTRRVGGKRYGHWELGG